MEICDGVVLVVGHFGTGLSLIAENPPETQENR
jgi:hypothetical protein